MMIFKKAIPRRTFLRGTGALLGLPLLDAMVPALAGQTAAKPALRLGYFYVPNGAFMNKWTPAKVGADYELSPILESLAPFRDRLLVLTGLDQIDGGAAHGSASSAFLTGLRISRNGLAPREGETEMSADQIAARHFGKETQLASIELGLDSTDFVGKSDDGTSLLFSNTMAWRNTNMPLPTENQPRAVFERLFGDSESTDKAVRLARIREKRSILDSVVESVGQLQRDLGGNDHSRLSGYLDSIRDVERQIQIAEEQSSRELPQLDRPAGIPATYTEHAKLMFDLLVLAYQIDLTRVCTFMMSREQAHRTYPEAGVANPHHPMSHHMGDAQKIEQLVKINTHHVKTFSYFLEKMRSTPDGDGNLLDHSLLVYGSGMSDGNNHSSLSLPILLLGGGGGRLKSGRHIRFEKSRLANLQLTVLNMAGIPVEKLGESNGKLDLLSV